MCEIAYRAEPRHERYGSLVESVTGQHLGDRLVLKIDRNKDEVRWQ
jgi:hypothetical protein